MTYQSPNDKGFSTELSRFLKAIGYICALIAVIGSAFVILGCFRISSYAFQTYESIDKIPYNKVGLLLGTSSWKSSGEPNDYFSNRILAASQLFKAGKIDYILVSGDNRHASYNEPRQMRNALIRAGIPKDRIISDYAGIRTLDSVIRARKVFLLKNVTIISQAFQNERALFIADNYDLEAIGFNALDPNKDSILPTRVGLREFLARIKCVFDIYIFKTQPKFLGEPESIAKNSPPKELSNKPKRLTSAIKMLSDNADVLAMNRKIAEYEPLAKTLTDVASIVKKQEDHIMVLENRIYKEENPELKSQQSELLKQEQKEALKMANEVASDSVSNGATTYIDDFEPSFDESLVEGENSSAQKTDNIESQRADNVPQSDDNTPSQGQSPDGQRRRQDIKTFHGDPWDYE